MRNPFGSEGDAFRLVLGVGAFAVLVAVASLAGGRRAGLGVLVGIGVVVAAWLLLAGRRKPPPTG
jgi:hypothetical protein